MPKSAVEDMMMAAGFVDVIVSMQAASSDYVKDWLPGSGAEDYVQAANITARRPAAKL